MEQTDGATYNGEWADGEPNGQGQYMELDMTTFKGTFINGKQTGKNQA